MNNDDIDYLKLLNESVNTQFLISSYSKKLNDINISLIKGNIKIKHVVWVFRVFKWKDRLINKCARIIDRNISKAIKKNPQSTFYVYKLCSEFEFKFHIFAYIKLYYEIK